MRTKACQPQGVFIGLAVNEHQIGLDVAIAVAQPLAAEVVVSISRLQSHVVQQCRQDGHQIVIQRLTMTSFGFAFVIAFEDG